MSNWRKIRILWGLVALMFLGCDSQNAWDCVQSAGPIVQKEFSVEQFKKIIIWNRVQLIVSSGTQRSVIVETGENLMNDILVRVEDSILKVSDRNSCNFTREYGITKVYVTAPVDSLEIRSSSGLPVLGQGPITFKKLTLISEDREQDGEFHVDGDFIFDALSSSFFTGIILLENQAICLLFELDERCGAFLFINLLCVKCFTFLNKNVKNSSQLDSIGMIPFLS